MSVDVEGKSLVELLDMLVPAPPPEPIPMTPQTWGWLGLAVILFLAIFIEIYLFQRHRQANAYRRAALTDLQVAGDDPAKIAEVLRRTALAAYPRAQVAGLHGEDWIKFLQQTSDKVSISQSASRLLLEAPYRICPPSGEVSHMARAWIKTHKVKRGRR
ncbi:hypothetical protein RUE5091_01457 [Ruegeria denitrificans]|uniref:DUF4381 domain-containing protein n=1 Tax=Ruegeria denitrificans TaxID=1715692 RepID=A0A0P1I7D5_9RHOB|nr:DUF4381 domain-containing protein [Ruegeria denitrificans]CUJ94768.1 hypothetical protein RUE5091_01457 [Ruegeria denitrificans]